MRKAQEHIIWKKAIGTPKIYSLTSHCLYRNRFDQLPGCAVQQHPFIQILPKEAAEILMQNETLLIISTGSCFKLEYQLILAKDLH